MNKASSLLNKSIHREAKAETLTRKAAQCLLEGKVDKAVRLRNKASRLKGWSTRYLTRLDRLIIDGTAS